MLLPTRKTQPGYAAPKVISQRLTPAIRAEINKLAGNIALGRDAAGVHYRSDSVNGLFVGEEQALGLLCDYSRTYNERFDGFVLSNFRGEKIRVLNGELKHGA
jgi:hypothetical protein